SRGAARCGPGPGAAACAGAARCGCGRLLVLVGRDRAPTRAAPACSCATTRGLLVLLRPLVDRGVVVVRLLGNAEVDEHAIPVVACAHVAPLFPVAVQYPAQPDVGRALLHR